MQRGHAPPDMKLRDVTGWASRLYSRVNREDFGKGEVLEAWRFHPVRDRRRYDRLLKNLEKYGLLERSGRGDGFRGRLSPIATGLMSQIRRERQGALREAALFPLLHKEAWERGGASDVSDLRGLFAHLLRNEMGSEKDHKSLDRTIAIYKDALAFSRLDGVSDPPEPSDGPSDREPDSSSEGTTEQDQAVASSFGLAIDAVEERLHSLMQRKALIDHQIEQLEAAIVHLGGGQKEPAPGSSEGGQ